MKAGSSFVYNVRSFILFGYFVTLSQQWTCDHRIYCQNGQTGSQEECCSVVAGEKCDNGSSQICNTDIGNCCVDGICLGKYNLTVVRIDDTSMNLTWSSFLPVGEQYNYTVLYSTKFQKDPLMYSSHTVGNKSNYSLQWLTPSTWYYVQVGVWTGNEYKNLTEVVVAQTKATDHCLYNGRRVPVGEQLVVDCEESCYCSNTGRFQCVPVCSKQHANARACSETEARDNCCDLVHHCSYDTCSYLGEPVQHEYSWVIDCAENCTCYDGSVTCVPLCADIMVPENCTKPVLTKSPDGCCESYECHDTDHVCQYMNMSHRVGTWFQSTYCEICSCMSSREVNCINLSNCLSTRLPDKSGTCPESFLQDDICCQQVLCDKEKDNNDVLSTYSITKYTVPSSILVRFQFISTKEENAAIVMTLFYTTNANNNNYTVWTNVTVKFSDVIYTSNETLEFRDFGKPYVLYKVNRNYLLVIPRLIIETFYYVKLKISFDKSQKAISEYMTVTKAIQLPGLHTGAPNHLMSRLNRVYFSATNSSANSAFLSWTIPESLLYNISSFAINYKPFSRPEWQFTERLIFSDRNFKLKCLFHSSWYEAQLLAYPGERRIATTFFNTSSIKEISNSQFSFSITNISIGSSFVIITWDRLPVLVQEDVNDIEVLWIRENDEDTLLKDCVTANSVTYTLQDLTSGCMYTVWLGVSRKDGTIAFTNRMHFVSLHQYSSSHSGNQHSMIVAVTVATVSLVAMVIAIATVVYLLKCKHRASYQEHTSFENRIFQIYDNKDDREL